MAVHMLPLTLEVQAEEEARRVALVTVEAETAVAHCRDGAHDGGGVSGDGVPTTSKTADGSTRHVRRRGMLRQTSFDSAAAHHHHGTRELVNPAIQAPNRTVQKVTVARRRKKPVKPGIPKLRQAHMQRRVRELSLACKSG